jgi:hypothetical protein
MHMLLATLPQVVPQLAVARPSSNQGFSSARNALLSTHYDGRVVAACGGLRDGLDAALQTAASAPRQLVPALRFVPAKALKAFA